MSCRYKEECPSYSGWCEGPKQDFSRCVEFLITAYENEKAKEKPGDTLVFRVNSILSERMLTKIRDDILQQIENGGVVVIPAHIELLTDIPEGCGIRVVDKDGNEYISKGE